jgi:hypothetical protein
MRNRHSLSFLLAGASSSEQSARIRELRALSAVYCGFGHPATVALGDAIADAGAVSAALDQLARLPALRRRRLLASFGALALKASGSSTDARSAAAIKSAQKAGMAIQAPPERNVERI